MYSPFKKNMKKRLFFGAGGVNGWVFSGIMKGIEGKFPIDGVAGASVGSLFAIAVSLGFSADEFYKLSEQNIENYRTKLSTINPFNIVDKGLMTTDVLREAAGVIIAEKLGKEHVDITFKELYEKTGVELAILVFNATYERTEVLNHLSASDMAVSLAASMSCAIPGIFVPVFHDGCEYADGGVDEPNTIPRFDKNTFYFRLHGKHGKAKGKIGHRDYACRIMHGMTRRNDDSKNVINIDVPCGFDAAFSGFTVSSAMRTRLIWLGEMAVLKVLHRDIFDFVLLVVFYLHLRQK